MEVSMMETILFADVVAGVAGSLNVHLNQLANPL
jgi:hypothetical protein